LRLPRLPGFTRRRPLEVAGGLLAANVGDAANILVVSALLDALLAAPAALALLPGLAALRGAIATTMAARASTALHLGLLPPRARAVLAAEARRVAALAAATSVYAGALAALASGAGVWESVAIAFVSGAASMALLAPSAAWLAAVGYRRGLDPDSFLAPVLTILGDLSTVPTLVGAALLFSAAGGEPIVALAGAYVSVALVYAVASGGGRDARVVLESLWVLALVGALEAVTGGLLLSNADRLAALGVLHAVPSVLEDLGAAAAVTASTMSTLVHLEGPARALEKAPAKVLETVIGSIPALTVLAAITVAAAPLAGATADPASVARLLVAGGALLVAAYSALAAAIAVGAHRLGLDPDNVTIPLLTAIVDVLTIPALALLGGLLG